MNINFCYELKTSAKTRSPSFNLKWDNSNLVFVCVDVEKKNKTIQKHKNVKEKTALMVQSDTLKSNEQRQNWCSNL